MISPEPFINTCQTVRCNNTEVRSMDILGREKLIQTPRLYLTMIYHYALFKNDTSNVKSLSEFWKKNSVFAIYPVVLQLCLPFTDVYINTSVRSSLFCDVPHCGLAVSYRSLWITYQSHLQGSRWVPKVCPEISATKYQPHAASHFNRAEFWFTLRWNSEITQIYQYFCQSISDVWWTNQIYQYFCQSILDVWWTNQIYQYFCQSISEFWWTNQIYQYFCQSISDFWWTKWHLEQFCYCEWTHVTWKRKSQSIFNVYGSVHHNNILVYNSNKMHKSQSSFNP
jgi:hypothetical protein